MQHLILTLFLVEQLVSLSLSSKIRPAKNGTFAGPAASDRPKFRYWLPDGSIDAEVLRSDIQSAGALGMGGIEYVPFYNYGGQLGGPPTGVDWVKYGFGTPAYLERFEAALQAHADAGLLIDIGLGPSEGQGVPASSDEEGLQWDLIPFYEQFSMSGQTNKTIPGWGTGDLVALVSARVVQSTNITRIVGDSATSMAQNQTHEKLTLNADSVVDITDKVDKSTGLFFHELAVPRSNESHYIFSFYQKRALKRNLQFEDVGSSGSVWDNGSYAVDHFAAPGAKVTTKFWDMHILSHGNIKDLIKEVGHVGWEDSVELLSNISWSPTLLKRFQDDKGYNLRPFLPLIAYGNNKINLQSDAPGLYEAILDSKDIGRGFENDYREVLTRGYIEYLDTLRSWLHNTLSLKLSVQPSYNLPINMASVVPYVDVPESESLQGHNNVDGYRQFAGPSNLVGHKVISNELGAVFGRGFSFTIPELLQMANRGFAGGLNLYIIHGQSYSGNYGNTTWPGHVPLLYYVSDPYTAKRPDWDNGLSYAMEYLARVQLVQRQGIGRTDVVVYNENVTDPNFSDVYLSRDLNQGGWTYNYLSSANLLLPEAVVQNNTLASTRPAYKALVILGSQNLTLTTLQRIQTYVEDGLPVILSGGLPGYYPTGNASDRQNFEIAIKEFTHSAGVHTVANGAVAQQLTELGLRPQVALHTNGTMYTTWREDKEAGESYLYVYSDLVSSTGELGVQSAGTPYILDPWTGIQTPLLHYRVDGDKTMIPFLLAGNETAIFAFSEKSTNGIFVPEFRVRQAPASIIGDELTAQGLEVHASSNSPSCEIHLSSGKAINLNTSVEPKSQLGPWELIAELWEAPEDLYEASIVALKRNLTTMSLPTLTSWLNIPELQNASGVGYYKTRFNWPHAPSGKIGAYIQFPTVLNAIVPKVNGHIVPPLNPANPRADISPYLVEGENEVTATVPTTMWNYLRSRIDELESSGRPPILTLVGIPERSDNGLVGDVDLVPFERVIVS